MSFRKWRDLDSDAQKSVDEQIGKSIIKPGPEPEEPRFHTPDDSKRYQEDLARHLEERRKRHGG
jgi:hypothetical protein